MHRPEIEIAFGGHVGDVRGYAHPFAIFPYSGGGDRVVDRDKHEGDGVVGVKVQRDEGTVVVGYLVLGDAVGDFSIETGARADHCDFGVCVEEVENAACGDLLRIHPLVLAFDGEE